MTATEIAELFFQLELTLIASLKRNLSRHEKWEKEEGFDWEAWQSAKLRDIRRFQKENRKEVEKLAPVIDKETRQLIEQQYQEGGAEGFFRMNDRKVNALLDEMQTAQEKVEKAALRYIDDVYRKTVRATALGMATGSMTLQQATDAATKSFLESGINCVRYKNGRQVNIASYAEMALRTASTRATLMGEAKRRESMGVDTVLVSQYGACSETCLPWQGLVYIDDVWQDYNGPHTLGGTYGVSRNGHQYPLLSVAVRNGLFHPNCRHTLTTWFEGISTRPEPMDKAQIERTSKLEKKQRAMERGVRALKRLAAGTEDADQAADYRKQVRIAQKKLKAFVDENGDVLRRDYWRERYDGVPLREKISESIRGSGGEAEKNGKSMHQMLGKIDSNDTQMAKNLIDSFCKKYASSEYENMMVITNDGEVHVMTDYNPKGVDCSYLGDKLKGSYNIHTHPPDSTQFSFSTDVDMPNFFADGSAVMDAVDYKYHYRFVRPEGITWEQWDKVRYEVEDDISSILMEREIGLDDYEENVQHIVMAETCKRLHITSYTRRKL